MTGQLQCLAAVCSIAFCCTCFLTLQSSAAVQVLRCSGTGVKCPGGPCWKHYLGTACKLSTWDRYLCSSTGTKPISMYFKAVLGLLTVSCIFAVNLFMPTQMASSGFSPCKSVLFALVP